MTKQEWINWNEQRVRVDTLTEVKKAQQGEPFPDEVIAQLLEEAHEAFRQLNENLAQKQEWDDAD